MFMCNIQVMVILFFWHGGTNVKMHVHDWEMFVYEDGFEKFWEVRDSQEENLSLSLTGKLTLEDKVSKICSFLSIFFSSKSFASMLLM